MVPSNKTFLLLVGFVFSLAVSSQERSIKELIQESRNLAENDFFAADSLFKIAINRAEEESQELLFLANYRAGKNAKNYGFYEEATAYYQNALKAATKNQNDSAYTKATIRLSENVFASGKIEEGIQLAFEGLDLAKSTNNIDLIVDANGNLGELFRLSNQEELALEYNQYALKSALKSGDENKWARVYNNFGAVLGELDRNNEAIDTLKHALLLISDSNIFAKSKFTSNIAFCFRNLGEIDSALLYNQKALSLKKQISATKTYGYTYGAIGRCFGDLGEPDSAIKYTKIAYDLANKYNDVYRLKDAGFHLSKAYYDIGNYEKAFQYLHDGKELEDSLFGQQTEERINLFKRKYDYAKKQQELNRVKDQLRFEEEVSKQRLVIFSGVFLLIVLIIIVLILTIKKRNQEKKYIQLKLEQSAANNLKNQEALESFAQDLQEKNKSIRSLNELIQAHESKLKDLESNYDEKKTQLTETKILTDDDWTKFKLLFERVYPNFFENLNKSDKSFTKGEKRIMSLIKLNMNNKEASDTLGISSESVSKSKSRLKKKLDLAEDQDLNQYIHSI